MEEKIGDLEDRVAELQRKMELPEIVSDSDKLGDCWQELEETQGKVEKLYARWDELEAMTDSA